MSFAARFAARAFHWPPAGAVAKTALVARHRFITSGSTAGGNGGGGTKAGSPAVTVEITETMPGGGKAGQDTVKLDICGEIEEDEEEEMEEMLQEGPAGKEWGGPTRGGVLGEPTRFGDWERKGRCSDF